MEKLKTTITNPVNLNAIPFRTKFAMSLSNMSVLTKILCVILYLGFYSQHFTFTNFMKTTSVVIHELK